ncbi:receptor activity-modifying protein 2-like [Danio aesculapii]|uniref:receptor activity-modifying protein 2-like n=1 Tax=Danio aesculapii TaxID=1142201 RepID=UPI0024BF2101|nr:receptor activity-modifying protein 2-like [Danio aesculapii]
MQNLQSQITQDNNTVFEESFQDQYTQYHYHCYEQELEELGEFCWEVFDESMNIINKENWCNMEMVLRSYSHLTECMDNSSMLAGCFYPNHVVEHLFMKIHQQYFSSCNNEEDLSDAPPGVVLVATLLPIALIPFIVYIVVWKSSLKY